MPQIKFITSLKPILLENVRKPLTSIKPEIIKMNSGGIEVKGFLTFSKSIEMEDWSKMS